MCGIVAVLSDQDQASEMQVSRMADLLGHRGPDDRGTFCEHGVALGFRRLAIFDPSPSSHQPMVSHDARYVIVFNGAVYNFLELRRELEGLGHRFVSTGDTEVLLAAYSQWGPTCLARLNGMWSFIIYDRVERKVFGARDRFGVKPLFWAQSKHGVLFASEIKAIRPFCDGSQGLDPERIAAFLLDGHLDTDERTFYPGIASVPAGTAFEWQAGRGITWRRYWCLLEAAQQVAVPDEPVAAFQSIFDDAVRLRMRSDVPLGVQLSGGVDSTAIISRMAALREQSGRSDGDLQAFCYMDPCFDETPLIRASIEQTRASLFALESTPLQLWDSIGEHLWYQDEPVHSFAAVVGYRLMGLARSQGIKVILNGQGADEVLAGYPSYFNEYWAQLIRAGRWSAAASGMTKFAKASQRSALALGRKALRTAASQVMQNIPGYRWLANANRRRDVHRTSWLSEDVKRAWRTPPAASARTLDECLRYSVEKTPLPMHLRVEDRNSMAHGIELRLPFLDYRLVSFAFALGAQRKLAGEYTKVVLRAAMRGRIPEAVRVRVQKFGFPTSIDAWFRNEFYEPMRDLLASTDVRQSGLWNVQQLERDLALHRSGRVNLGTRLFDVAQVSLLLRMRTATASGRDSLSAR